MAKSKGPKMLPRGTSHLTIAKDDLSLPIFVHCFLLVRYELSIFMADKQRPTKWSVFRRILWSTVSKDLRRSRIPDLLELSVIHPVELMVTHSNDTTGQGLGCPLLLPSGAHPDCMVSVRHASWAWASQEQKPSANHCPTYGSASVVCNTQSKKWMSMLLSAMLKPSMQYPSTWKKRKSVQALGKKLPAEGISKDLRRGQTRKSMQFVLLSFG